MADDQSKAPKKKAAANRAASYEVGYAKPPAETRFKPGQSGNPRGRPKGAKNKRQHISTETLHDIILSEAYRKVTITEGNKRKEIPILRATVRSIALAAAKGQPSAQKLLLDIVNKTEAARRQAIERTAEEFVQYQFEWEEVFEQCRAKGLPLPNPAPHPHDLQFDEASGAITIIGPQNEAKKLKWEKLSDDLQGIEDCIDELQKLCTDPKNEDIKHLIEDDIAFETSTRDRIRAALKGWRRRT